MADTPSPILLLRLQGVGGNVNTWGGYLNTALSTLEQASKGYQPLAVVGSATIAWTQYATGNTGQCAFLRLTGPAGDGTLATPATLTFPSYQNFLGVFNAAGAAVTIMCAGGTGVAIPAGYWALLYCDGLDYRQAAPTLLSGAVTLAGQIHGVSAGTAGTDAVNVSQMETAIATAALPATGGTVLNSSTDTTAGYLAQKVNGFGLLQRITQNASADEDSAIVAIGYTAAGTNAYTISPSPTPGAATAFITAYLIEFINANTATCTLNDGSGTYPLVNDDGAALGPGDLPAGAMRLVIFDGVSFRTRAADLPAHIPMGTALAAATGITLSP